MLQMHEYIRYLMIHSFIKNDGDIVISIGISFTAMTMRIRKIMVRGFFIGDNIFDFFPVNVRKLLFSFLYC